MKYQKINSIYKRDEKTNKFIMGSYADPNIEYLANNEWLFEEKVDGTNIRVSWDGAKVDFGGRTDSAQIPAHLIMHLVNTFTVDLLKEVFPMESDSDPITIYGEGFGHKIQNGGNYLENKEIGFVLFDILIGNFYLKREALEDIATQLGIPIVPLIGQGTLDDAINIVKSGLCSWWGDFESEGIVAKPCVQMFSRTGHRVITKIKARDFK